MTSTACEQKPKEGWVETSVKFVKRSFLEPIVFLHGLANTFLFVSLHQLFQDKVCLQIFQQTTEYCRYLNLQDDELKDDIVSEVSVWSTYKEYMVLIPGALSALFIGSWCDKFENGKRYCLIATCLAHLVEVSLFLANAIYMDSRKYFFALNIALTNLLLCNEQPYS